jgi:hypothetical protein
MGLAAKTEVQPFGVLEGAVPPAGVTDPLWGGAYAAHSFPWFDAATPFTVPATRRVITIDDVIAATGERDPAAGAAPGRPACQPHGVNARRPLPGRSAGRRPTVTGVAAAPCATGPASRRRAPEGRRV